MKNDKIPTAVELQSRVVTLELRASSLRRALEARVVHRFRLATGSSQCDECGVYYQGQPLSTKDPNWKAMPPDEHVETCALYVPADERSFTSFR